jgi:hypothetical protein
MSSQSHRGKHPSDSKLFSEKNITTIRKAVEDFSYLLTQDYSEKSALKLVGDKYYLNERQRKAVLRTACPDQSLHLRKLKECKPEDLKNKKVLIDGFNILITIESALSGGIILHCRDGCYRDIASIHSTYRKVKETEPAISLIVEALNKLKISECEIYLDSPVSNSGRLKKMIGEVKTNFQLKAILDYNPDKVLIESGNIIATSDGHILDRSVNGFFCLSRFVIDTKIAGANILSLM